jgi:hypothetical protein
MVDNTRDAVPDERHVEINQQAEAFVGQAEVRKKLLFVDWGKDLDRFDFHNDFVFNDQIGPEAGFDADTIINHWNRRLARRPETSPAKFIRQNRMVDRFQQARPQPDMDVEGAVDDLFGDGVLGHKGAERSLAKPLSRKVPQRKQHIKIKI